jgi:RsiW-degrading membrane proteinase PrsW (M82 family)
MKNISRPGTILAMAGTALILAGIITMPHYEFGLYITYAGFLLAGLFWLWTVMDVIGAPNLKSFQKMFWLVVTILIPVMGGLMFYVMQQQHDKWLN